MCPYLRVGESMKSCAAYMGPNKEPSVYEQDYFCTTCSHSSCVWFASKGKEVAEDSGAMSVSDPTYAELIARVCAHSVN
jgi:hypothetical protein